MISQKNLAQIFRSLSSPSLVICPNGPNFPIIEVNDAYLQLKKLTRAQLSGKDFFDNNQYYNLLESKDSLNQVLIQKKTNKIPPRRYEVGTPGKVKYLEVANTPILDENGEVIYIVHSVTDLTEGISTIKRLNDLENLERNILELNSQNNSTVEHLLSCYLIGIEGLFPQMQCSILKIKNNRLYNWSSPSMPKKYIAAMQNLPIQDNMGSCGTAAFFKKNVIVGDIKTDPRWSHYKHIALPHGLRACWSYPIINSTGEVMAVLGMYYKEPKTPDKEESKVIDRVTAILEIILESKQKSEIIEEKNLLMKQGQELAHLGTWSWDIQNNVLNWSKTLYSIYGLNSKEFNATYEDYQNLLHPDDRQRVHELITNALKTSEEVDFEERIIRPNREIRYLRSWGKLKSDFQGVPLEMIGACLDITEIKKAQEDLQASESRLNNLIEAQTNYVIRISLDGIYQYCNGKYLEDFNWLLEDKTLTATVITITIQPYHHQRVIDFKKKCIATPGKVFQVELDKLDPSGSSRQTLWQFIGLPNANGQAIEIQCIGLDVTDLKKAEKALRISNQRYEYVNQATNDAIFDWNILSGEVQWGDGFFKLLGLERCEGINTFSEWEQLVHPEEISAVRSSLLDSIQDPHQNNWIGEYRLRKADGNYACVEGKGYILRDENKRGVQMIGVLRDLTERLNYIADIEKQNQKLLEIAWMQSHQVRAPLARIMGLVELVKNNPIDSESKQLLALLSSSANELDFVIKTISEKTHHMNLKSKY